MRVGSRTVELVEVGPAHTDGDVIVHVPDAGVVYTGDILFADDHPIMWTGPAENWIAACDLIISTGAQHIVPGHGAVVGPDYVSLFRSYLELVQAHAADRHRAGVPYWQAAAELTLPEPMDAWGRPERLALTLAAAYHHLGDPEPDRLAALTHAAELDTGTD